MITRVYRLLLKNNKKKKTSYDTYIRTSYMHTVTICTPSIFSKSDRFKKHSESKKRYSPIVVSDQKGIDSLSQIKKGYKLSIVANQKGIEQIKKE